MQRETKKLVYKVARGVTGGHTLQSLLCNCIARLHEVRSRVEPLGVDGGEVRFINFVRQHKGITFGAFHKITKGAAQHVVNMDGKGDSWKLMTVTAKSESRPEGEFVEGTLFFGIWKNHVILHQTMSCRVEQLEGHLEWLAQKTAAEGQESATSLLLVSLDDPLPKHIREKDNQQVKSVKIASAVESRPRTQVSGTHNTTLNFTPSGGAWEGIKSILSAMRIPLGDEIVLKEALRAKDLRVRLELSCTKKQAESSAGDVLGKLGHALRHTDGDFYTVELMDGTIIKGKEIKVERGFRVDCADRLPVLESMFSAMMEFFEVLVDSQTIIEQEAFGNVK